MITQQEVYNALNFNWQSGQQVRQKIADARHKPRWKINPRSIYAHLESLVEGGFADRHEREPTAEEVGKRGNNKIFEYRKTGSKIPHYENERELGELALSPA
ncbi:hypothetical protein FJZ19_03860 [Candidatus Pacearchaeota archaeon]|nr:hypothetical protein [Candidatus Pacearchaeota archaeon]